MDFLYGIGGANIPVIKEFDVESTTVLYAGEAVGIKNGLVTKNLEDGVLGVCAEDHSGKEDILNKRANGKKIRVDVTMGGVYKMKAPVINPLSGGMKLTVSAGEACEGLDGAKVVLYMKDAFSVNNDKIGTVYNVVSSAEEAGNIALNLDRTCGVSLGDTFMLLPAPGFEGKFGTMDTGIKVVGRDIEGGNLHVMISNKIFG